MPQIFETLYLLGVLHGQEALEMCTPDCFICSAFWLEYNRGYEEGRALLVAQIL